MDVPEEVVIERQVPVPTPVIRQVYVDVPVRSSGSAAIGGANNFN